MHSLEVSIGFPPLTLDSSNKISIQKLKTECFTESSNGRKHFGNQHLGVSKIIETKQFRNKNKAHVHMTIIISL